MPINLPPVGQLLGSLNPMQEWLRPRVPPPNNYVTSAEASSDAEDTQINPHGWLKRTFARRRRSMPSDDPLRGQSIDIET